MESEEEHMLRDERDNLLKLGKRRYQLIELQEPDLLRDLFPYDEPPRLAFDGMSVPMYLPDDFFITDTTFRDGQQARPPYTVEQVVELYKMLHRLGGPNGVIRQCEFFLYRKQEREAVERCLELGYKYPEITGWIRARKEDFQLVKEMGLKETGILMSVSDYHIYLKLKKTRRQAMEEYLDMARTAIEAGVKPRCHLEDITRADFYGFVIPFVQALMDLADESGVPIKIRACDTLGYGVPWSEAVLPRSVPKIIHALRVECGVPPQQLEWHGHNDFHLVIANSLAAWLYGCAAVNGTLLGYGERTGNAPIEGLIFHFIALKGEMFGIDTTVISEIADYYRKVIGDEIPANYPFVGESFNVTRAGIHADGLLKDEEIYNIFDTTKLLNRPPKVGITDKSGLAGIAHWISSRFSKKIDKRHPGVIKIYEWVMKQYEEGRTTSISDKEMMELVKQHLPELLEGGDV